MAVGPTICSATAQPHSVNPQHNPRHGQNTQPTARPTAQPHSTAPRHSTTAQPHSTSPRHSPWHNPWHITQEHTSRAPFPAQPHGTAPWHSAPAQHHDTTPWLEAPTRTDSPFLDSQESQHWTPDCGADKLLHGALLASWQHAERPTSASLSPAPFRYHHGMYSQAIPGPPVAHPWCHPHRPRCQLGCGHSAMTGEWTPPSREQGEPHFAEDNLISSP